MSKYYSINEFSKILGISAQTLRNWDKNNKLKPHHTSTNGYRYYSHEQLNQVLNKDYVRCDDKSDEMYVNIIISISNLYYLNVSDTTKQIINKIKELIEEGDKNDKNIEDKIKTK